MLKRNKTLMIAFVALYSLAFTEAYCRWLVPKIMIGPSFTAVHPDFGWYGRKSFTGRRVTREFDMHFTTGAQSFRGGDYDREKPDGWTRIASFGNSQTFGVGVNDDETYSHLLEQLLRERVDPSVEVINMSVTDTGTGIILAMWDDILSYHPDAIVVRYDDYNYRAPGRLWRVKDGQLVRSRRQAKGQFRRWMSQWDILQRCESLAAYGFARILVSRHIKSASKLPKTLFSFGSGPSVRKPARSTDDLEYRLLGELIDRCAQAKIPLVLATFDLKPDRRKVFDDLTSRPGVIVVDLKSKVAEPKYYFDVDEHLNPAGHRYVAEQLAAVFASQLQGLFHASRTP
jgi:lysophospholipase L1-like esterase